MSKVFMLMRNNVSYFQEVLESQNQEFTENQEDVVAMNPT